MKTFSKHYLSYFFTLNIIYLLLSLIIIRRTEQVMPFIRLEVGVMLIALFLSIAHTIYKSEKGHPILNVILAYIFIFPSLYVVRFNFGKLLFRSAALIYILFVGIGIIYSIALYIASKKYKKEVDDLNQLLNNQTHNDETSE